MQGKKYSYETPIVTRLSVVIPTYNERNNVVELINRLTEILEALLKNAYEIILVDDNSPDRTWELAEKLADSHPRLRILRREGKRDLASAIVQAWKIARGDVLGVMDADLQHPPEALSTLWHEISRGGDLVVASRYVTGGGVSQWHWRRRLISQTAKIIGQILLPSAAKRVSDPLSGYFLVRREAIAGKALDPIGYKILLEVLVRGRIISISEIGYDFRERNTDQSKVTWKICVKYLIHLWRLRTS